ncbi:hypothetical protein [Paenibacillus sp. FSL K6-2859]|jgi:hypothetical protein|uniref:hypothetical protein n=1 Tax=Paenibacillus sp. FSL K6-2859 TaxID=2921482 RepID=UPI0030FA0D3E
MFDGINYGVGKIRFEGIDAFDEYREPELHQANLLWKEGKYQGALLNYDSVIAISTRQFRVPEFKVACINKLKLLQMLFRANKLWTTNDCQQLIDLYDDS